MPSLTPPLPRHLLTRYDVSIWSNPANARAGPREVVSDAQKGGGRVKGWEHLSHSHPLLLTSLHIRPG